MSEIIPKIRDTGNQVITLLDLLGLKPILALTLTSTVLTGIYDLIQKKRRNVYRISSDDQWTEPKYTYPETHAFRKVSPYKHRSSNRKNR